MNTTLPTSKTGKATHSNLATLLPPQDRPAPIEVPTEIGRKPNHRNLITILCLGLLAGLGFTTLGYQWWTTGRFIETTDDAYVGGDVTIISNKVSGYIAQVCVLDNQVVHTGDLLIKLDDRDYQASLAKAEATITFEKASLQNLEATLNQQQAVVAQAQAEVDSTQAELERAQADESRYQTLLSSGAVSTESFQRADALYKESVASGEKAQAALTAAERQIAVIQTQEDKVKASLNQAIAERDLAQLNVSYTEIRSPIDGIIGNRSARLGEFNPVGTQLLSLVPLHGLWIDANFKENQLVHIQPGNPADVTVDAIPGKVFHGKVLSLAPATGAQFSILPPENATGNFTKIVQRVTVRIMLQEESQGQSSLRPGISVVAKVDGRPTDR